MSVIQQPPMTALKVDEIVLFVLSYFLISCLFSAYSQRFGAAAG
jgi:hypothetical protein